MADIYALRDPITKDIRYIGKANSASKRLASHIRDSSARDTPVYRWIRKLAKQGLIPVIDVLEVAEDWIEAERRLIAVSRAQGCRLLNVAAGGDEPYCSLAVRAENGRKIAEAIHFDPFRRRAWELNKAIGSALQKDQVSNATRAKLRAAALKSPKLFGRFAALLDRVES